MCHSIHVKIRGQLVGADSPFHLVGSRELRLSGLTAGTFEDHCLTQAQSRLGPALPLSPGFAPGPEILALNGGHLKLASCPSPRCQSAGHLKLTFSQGMLG